MQEINEEWRDIKGCEIYQVSSLGRVKSIRRTAKSKNGSIRTVGEKILKPRKNKNGYLMVHLSNEGKKKNLYIHRLVADAFLENPYNLPQVNHKDENTLNNRVENLEFCTQDYNNKYGTRTERTSKKVKCLETGFIYPSTIEVERKLGFSSANISRCCNKKRKTCGGLHWEWA